MKRDTLTYGPGFVVPYGRLHPTNPAGDSFSVATFSPYLEAMGEPALDPAKIRHDVYRVTYEPSFRPTATFRLVAGKAGCTMVRKQVRVMRGEDGPMEPWKRPMDLLHADSMAVSDSACRALVAAFDSLRLLAEPEREISVGPDGEGFVFEQLTGGRYAARDVWMPDTSVAKRRFLLAGRAFAEAAGYGGDRFSPRK